MHARMQCTQIKAISGMISLPATFLVAYLFTLTVHSALLLLCSCLQYDCINKNKTYNCAGHSKSIILVHMAWYTHAHGSLKSQFIRGIQAIAASQDYFH
jgi:uncharacterized membrane protein YvlD (DUF360 family)